MNKSDDERASLRNRLIVAQPEVDRLSTLAAQAHLCRKVPNRLQRVIGMLNDLIVEASR
jgi:hypothetical protein